MKDALIKLLKVKSIITILLTIIFCILAVKGTISGKEFLTIFTMIVSFYFGVQSTKE